MARRYVVGAKWRRERSQTPNLRGLRRVALGDRSPVAPGGRSTSSRLLMMHGAGVSKNRHASFIELISESTRCQLLDLAGGDFHMALRMGACFGQLDLHVVAQAGNEAKQAVAGKPVEAAAKQVGYLGLSCCSAAPFNRFLINSMSCGGVAMPLLDFF